MYGPCADGSSDARHSLKETCSDSHLLPTNYALHQDLPACLEKGPPDAGDDLGGYEGRFAGTAAVGHVDQIDHDALPEDDERRPGEDPVFPILGVLHANGDGQGGHLKSDAE